MTGTIDLEGNVGPIGGLRAEGIGRRRRPVSTPFIVPAAQGEDDIEAARSAAGDAFEIIPVATLDEALAVLERLGGDPAAFRTTDTDCVPVGLPLSEV